MQGNNVLLSSSTSMNMLNSFELTKSPMTMLKEGTIFSFNAEDMAAHKELRNTVQLDAPRTPAALRQISDNTMFSMSMSTVLSHTFIPEDTTAVGGEDDDDVDQDAAITYMGDDGGGGGPKGGGGIGMATVDAIHMPPQQPLNKRQVKAIQKKSSMTPEAYAKYMAYRDKNNDSVARSRKKKRQKLAESEKRCDELESDNHALTTRIVALEAEVKSLMTLLLKNTIRPTDNTKEEPLE